MALPSTLTEVIEAIETALGPTLLWPASIDAGTPAIFRQVTTSADFPSGSPFDLVRDLPAAVVVYRGSSYHQENPDFATSRIGIGIITRWPNDRTGRMALLRGKGLFNIATQVRKALRYSQALADAHWLANVSGTAVFSDAAAPGRDYVAQELQFEVQHMDNLPA